MPRKPKPGIPGYSIKKPGKGMDKVYRPDRDGPKRPGKPGNGIKYPQPIKPGNPPLTDAEKKKAYLKKQIEMSKNSGTGKATTVPVKPVKRGTPGNKLNPLPTVGTKPVKTTKPGGGKKYIPRTPVKTPKPGDGMKYMPRNPGKK